VDEIHLNKDDSLNFVDQKVNIKCISLNPDFFLAQIETDSDQIEKQECIIRLRKVDFQTENKPRVLGLKIIAESQGPRTQEKYQIEAKVDFPFLSSFKIKNQVNQVFFTKTNRTAFLEVDNINDLEFVVEDPSLIKYEVIPREEDNPSKIKISVFRNVSTSFDDSKFVIKNKFTNQKEEIELNFDVDKLREDSVYYFMLFTRAQLLDIFTFFILVCLVYFISKYFLMGGVNILIKY